MNEAASIVYNTLSSSSLSILITSMTTVNAEFGSVNRCANYTNRRIEIKDNAGR